MTWFSCCYITVVLDIVAHVLQNGSQMLHHLHVLILTQRLLAKPCNLVASQIKWAQLFVNQSLLHQEFNVLSNRDIERSEIVGIYAQCNLFYSTLWAKWAPWDVKPNLPTIAGVLAMACLKSKPSNKGVPGYIDIHQSVLYQRWCEHLPGLAQPTAWISSGLGSASLRVCFACSNSWRILWNTFCICKSNKSIYSNDWNWLICQLTLGKSSFLMGI